MEDIGKLAILVWQRKSVPKKTKNPQNGKSGGFKALFSNTYCYLGKNKIQRMQFSVLEFYFFTCR